MSAMTPLSCAIGDADRDVAKRARHRARRRQGAGGRFVHLKIFRSCVLPQVTIEGFQAKDGANRANGRDITFPDGQKLFVGSSGTGAPDERPDP